MDMKDIVAVNDSFDQLRETGIQFQKKTVDSLLAFSVVVYILKQKCENEEQDFSEKALEYWGLSSSGASQAAKVGERADRFSEHSNILPPSSRTLYELATIPEKKFEEVIELGDVTPNLTVTEAKSLKASLKDEKKKENFDDPFATNKNSNNNMEAKDRDNVIEGEVMPNNSELSDIKNKELKPKALTAVEAVDLLNINVGAYYESEIQAGLSPRFRLDEAYELLTGKKL